MEKLRAVAKKRMKSLQQELLAKAQADAVNPKPESLGGIITRGKNELGAEGLEHHAWLSGVGSRFHHE